MENGWHEVATEDDLPPGEDDVIQVEAAGTLLALYRLGNELYATADRCTHEEASLADGYLQDDTIECPRHQGVFHIPSGRAMQPPVSVDIQTYPVRAEAGRILVRI